MELARANRLHIGIFGKVNSGKSSLINLLTNREVSLISDKEGTTTDSVYKNIEFGALGPVVLMDTPGLGDKTELGFLREKRSKKDLERADIVLIVISDPEISEELEIIKSLKKTPKIIAINKCDILSHEDKQKIYDKLKDLKIKIIEISVKENTGIEKLRSEIIKLKPEEEIQIFEGLAREKDLVLLVMPQDIAAPQKRLILPQAESIRELLDRNCLVMAVKLEEYEDMLENLKRPPNLIVTDSQVFKEVFEKKPKESKLTSFSVLFAKSKGNIKSYMEGVRAFSKINKDSKILIAECCAHAPATEDIGRIKIPKMLKKKFGEDLQVDFQSGAFLPDDISKYDLIIQCGGCMLTRKNILSRIDRADNLQVPITNYGLTIAYFKEILDKIVI
ncbi:[FeFe] hydrogenase H-cluster maturation GTPase HydF [uncultured Peptoniphilus sp.]|uniref:[FeFe] hydrogenase H-cluster maturation GTPase HydF n=1 Tax=uncultured Peptoniphilus sp. TaxID=254354 RepID=UPI0028049750|nr:[FeFe] hydrogenase H-cluster maturation GTPase HydF [uncultured Peptoniphilus sp.]